MAKWSSLEIDFGEELRRPVQDAVAQISERAVNDSQRDVSCCKKCQREVRKMFILHMEQQKGPVPKSSKRRYDADKSMRAFLSRRKRNIGEGKDVEGFSKECMLNVRGN